MVLYVVVVFTTVGAGIADFCFSMRMTGATRLLLEEFKLPSVEELVGSRLDSGVAALSPAVAALSPAGPAVAEACDCEPPIPPPELDIF